MSDDALVDKKKLNIWFVLLGVAGFLLFIFNQDNAFPSSSLQFKIPREKIQEDAAALAKELGFTQDSKIKSTVFQTDQSTTLFLQHHYGPKEADQLIKNQLPCFYWNSRFCSPGQLEEFEVDRTPDGKLVALVHKVPNDLTLPSMKPEEGFQTFRNFLQKHTNLDPNQFKQLSFKTEHKKSRDDLSYTFEDQEHDYKGARTRLDFALAGNQISSFRQYLHVPDTWTLKYTSMFSYNRVLNICFWAFHYSMLGAAFLYFLNLMVQRSVNWKFPLRIAGTITALTALSSIAGLPSMMHYYSTENPELSFVFMMLIGIAGMAVTSMLTNVALFAPAENIYKKLYAKGVLLGDFVTRSGISGIDYRTGIVLGLLTCGISQGWQNLYYWIGSYFGISCPLGVDHPEIFGSTFPCFDLMALGSIASFTEELSYRVIVLLVAQRYLRNFWLANFIQAFIWSLGHTTYPQSPIWARVGELTVDGFVIGAIFRVYGILPCIVSHYLFDSFMPTLFKANDPKLVIAGALAITPPFLFFMLSKYWSSKPQVEASSDLPKNKSRVRLALEAWLNKSFDTQAAETQVEQTAARPISKLAMVLTLVCVPLCIALTFIQKPDPLSMSVSRDEAVKMAREYVHKEGLDDPALSLCFQKLRGDINDEACQCLQDKLGRDRFEQTFNDTAHPQIWNVRFCGQQMIKEIVVQIDACKKSVIGATLKLPDDSVGAHLSQAEAVGRVEKFLREYHKDMLPFKLVGQKSFERSGRTDYSTEWECPRFGASDSKLRLECATVGDVVSGFKLNWDLPDKWSWKYREFTIRRGAMTFIVVLELLILIVATLVSLLRVPKNHAPSFRWIGGYVGLMAALIAAMVALQTPNLLSSYDSQTPFIPFVIQTYLYQLINMIPILCIFGVLLIVAADAGQQFTPFDRSRTQADKQVPLISQGTSVSNSLFTGYAIGAIAVLLTVGAIKLICSYTTEAVYSSYDIAAWLAQSQCPALLAVVFAALCSVASVPISGVADGIIRRYLPSKLKFTFANLLFSVAVAGMTRQSHDIVLLAALIFAAIQIIYILLKRVFSKDPFSLAVAVYFFIVTFAASVLYQLARPLLQVDAFVCIAALLLPVISTFSMRSSNQQG